MDEDEASQIDAVEGESRPIRGAGLHLSEILDDPNNVGLICSGLCGETSRQSQREPRGGRAIAGAPRRDLVQGATMKAAVQHPVETEVFAEAHPSALDRRTHETLPKSDRAECASFDRGDPLAQKIHSFRLATSRHRFAPIHRSRLSSLFVLIDSRFGEKSQELCPQDFSHDFSSMKFAGGTVELGRMTTYHFTLFETVIGECAIVWSGRGIAGAQLPEACAFETRRRLLDRFPDAREASPPPDVARARDGMAALLRGEARDLSGVALDMDLVPPFHRRVYAATRTIKSGETQTYGAIARDIGAPGAARAVGRALGRNPFAILVPCHRVLGASGKLGGFSAHGGVATKSRLLAIEGAPTSADQRQTRQNRN